MVEIIKKNKNLLLVIVDIAVIIACYLVSIFFLSINITDDYKTLIKELAIAVVTYEIFLNIFQMYRNMMRYEVGKDYIKYIISSFLSIIILSILALVFNFKYLDIKLNILAGVLTAGMFVMYRLAGRSVLSRRME